MPDADFLSTLGKRIVQARKAAGLSQVKLAEKIGIDVKTLSRYENGHYAPDANVLHVIGKVTDMPVGWICGCEKTSAPDNQERTQKLKRQWSQGQEPSIDPSSGPVVETHEVFVGYFDFQGRRISTNLLFRTSGEPPRFGGWIPSESGDADG